MSGNRTILKLGLVMGAAFAGGIPIQTCAPVVQKEHVEQFTKAFTNFAQWLHTLLKKAKAADFPQFVSQLKFGTLQKLENLKNVIPDVPPANAKLKIVVEEAYAMVDNIYKKLSTAKSIMQLRASATTDCSLQTILDKSKADLDELIKYADTNPGAYAPEAVAHLKEFRKKEFQKIYNDLHATTLGHLIAALTKYLPML